jgi:hypothetical protein
VVIVVPVQRNALERDGDPDRQAPTTVVPSPLTPFARQPVVAWLRKIGVAQFVPVKPPLQEQVKLPPLGMHVPPF